MANTSSIGSTNHPVKRRLVLCPPPPPLREGKPQHGDWPAIYRWTYGKFRREADRAWEMLPLPGEYFSEFTLPLFLRYVDCADGVICDWELGPREDEAEREVRRLRKALGEYLAATTETDIREVDE